MHTIDERTLHVTSVFAETGDHAVLDHEADEDEKILVALGYRQEFKRFVPWCRYQTITFFDNIQATSHG